MKRGTSLPSPSRKQTISACGPIAAKPAAQARPYPAPRFGNDARAGSRARAACRIGRSVIHDDHLIDMFRQHLTHRIRDRLFFVQARNDDRDMPVDIRDAHGSADRFDVANQMPHQEFACMRAPPPRRSLLLKGVGRPAISSRRIFRDRASSISYQPGTLINRQSDLAQRARP